MKKLSIFFVSILLFSACEGAKESTEKQFYTELDSLKNKYADKDITIKKRKFNEDVDQLTDVFLYTNADKDNLGGRVLFHDGMKYKLSYGQISEYDYANNPLSKNLMIRVENDKYSNASGWISVEYIEEFRGLKEYLK